MTELGRALAAKILQASPMPDGIMAINSALWIDLMVGLRQAGVRIPQDISVIGVNNILRADLVQPPMSSVIPPPGEMVNIMMHRLLTRIANHALAPEEFLFIPRFICRQSVIAVESFLGE